MLQIVHHWFGPVTHTDPAHSVIGYAVSLGNRCGFCSSRHQADLHGAGLRTVAQAIRDERFERIADERIRQAALYGYAGYGMVGTDWTEVAEQAHYASRVANALGMRRRKWWANPDGNAPNLLWREAAADVPAVVSHRVKSHLRAWHGEEPGPNRGWVENYLADLSRRDRAIARLALLTAMASHQVDRTVLDAFRTEIAEHWKLEEVVQWGAWLGARRVIDRKSRGVEHAA